MVRSQGPSYGGLFSWSPFLGRLVTSMHRVTAPEVIDDFVLLKRGERCSILLRRETERLLRAQPFLADAFVTAYADGVDAVRVEVVTIDEPSAVASLSVMDQSPYLRALTLGNANLRGRGIYIAGGWREGFAYRDSYMLNYANYQLFSRPWRMEFDAARREHGYEVVSELAYPFLSDLQPRAWRVSGGVSDELIPFRSPDRRGLAVGLRRQFADAGGVVRVGAPGRLALVGGSISSERSVPDAMGTIVTDTGRIADTTGVLDARYTDQRMTRANLLLGFRQVNFLQVSGFDALAGTQDVRRGVQVGLTLGRTLPGGAPEDAWFGAFNLYAGAGSPRSFIAAEVLGEGRQVAGQERWDALLVSGRLAGYLRPHPRHTVMVSAEYGAGRRQRVPFQLALGTRRGGVRGYEGEQVGGGARLVLRAEERWRLGNVRGTADLGVAAFTDVGRLWAGDVPLGVTTGYRPSVGFSILAAVPPRSRRLWRLDVAFPLASHAGARWNIRVTNEDRTREFWIEPGDLRRAHDQSVLRTRDWGPGARQ